MNQQPNELATIQIAPVAAPRDCVEHLNFIGFEPQLDDNAFHAEKRTTLPSVSQGESRKDSLTMYWSGRLACFLFGWKMYQIQQLDRRRRLERIRLLTLSLLSVRD